MIQVQLRILAHNEQDAQQAMALLQPQQGSLRWRPARPGRRRGWYAYGTLELEAPANKQLPAPFSSEG